MRWIRWSGVAAAAMMLGAAPPLEGQQDLSGQWQLDSARSADVSVEFAKLLQRKGLRTGPLASPQVGVGGRVPGTAVPAVVPQGGGDASVAVLRENLVALAAGPSAFEIQQTDSTVEFYPLDLSFDNLILFPDGRKTVHAARFDPELDVEVKAEWNKGRLKVKRKSTGLELTQYFSRVLEPEAFLVVASEIKGKQLPEKLELVQLYRPRQ